MAECQKCVHAYLVGTIEQISGVMDRAIIWNIKCRAREMLNEDFSFDVCHDIFEERATPINLFY